MADTSDNRAATLTSPLRQHEGAGSPEGGDEREQHQSEARPSRSTVALVGGRESPSQSSSSNNNNRASATSATTGGGHPEDPDDQPCQSCGNFPARFQCAACQSVRYCSRDCQADDWHIHYQECAEFVDAANNRNGADGNEIVGGGDLAQAEAGRGGQPRRSTSRVAAGRSSRATVRSTASTATMVGDSLGNEADRIRETANRPRRRPQEPPRRRPRLTPEQIAAYEEAERIADMKFYMLQVYKIIKPVVICICLSILWVKISMAGSDYRPTQASYTVYKETETSTPTQNFVGSLANAGIIISQIVIVTIIIVILFKKGYIKVLIGFFMVVVALLLGFMGYVLILNLIQVLRIPLDYVTMAFALWNFAVVGLVSVFWKGPMWLQQTYLTLMSSLMAFSLTGLAEWTTWMLLALLVIWDLIAVLCPFGPLKILVESSRNQNQEVPALLYTGRLRIENRKHMKASIDTTPLIVSPNPTYTSLSPLGDLIVNAVWFMASPPDSKIGHTISFQDKTNLSERRLEQQTNDNRIATGEGTAAGPAYQSHSRTTGREGGSSIGSDRSSALGAPSFNMDGMSRTSSTMNLVAPGSRDEDPHAIEMLARRSPPTNGSGARDGISSQQASPSDQHAQRREEQQQRSQQQQPLQRQDQQRRGQHDSRYPEDGGEYDDDDDDDDDGGGLKLGLGDFVFYSVLIARAAMFDWVTTLCCMVAVLTGMNATIFLLAIYRKALPALPISICFGMLFYFATRFAVVPFLAVLAPNQVFI